MKQSLKWACLAAIGTASMMLVACSGSEVGLTNAAVCRRTTAAACDRAIECDNWPGTRDDCNTASMFECCEGEACDWPAAATSQQTDACAAAWSGKACDAYWPPGTACDGLLSDEPPADQREEEEEEVRGGGEGGEEGPGGSSDRDSREAGLGAYAICFSDEQCSSSEEGCFDLRYDRNAASVCTSRCNGRDDTTTCGSSGVCVPQYEAAAVCLERCHGDTDCPRELRCRELLLDGDPRVCLP